MSTIIMLAIQLAFKYSKIKFYSIFTSSFPSPSQSTEKLLLFWSFFGVKFIILKDNLMDIWSIHTMHTTVPPLNLKSESPAEFNANKNIFFMVMWFYPRILFSNGHFQHFDCFPWWMGYPFIIIIIIIVIVVIIIEHVHSVYWLINIHAYIPLPMCNLISEKL